MARVLAFGAITYAALTDWSWYYNASQNRGFDALDQPDAWRGVTFDSYIWLDMAVTQSGPADKPYWVNFVGKGLVLEDGEVVAGRMNGIFCFERDASGKLRFGFHVSGFDLSAKMVAGAIADGNAFSGSVLTERLLGGADTFLLSPKADQMRGLGGNDRMEGRDGADTLSGDRGDDTLLGGNGADSLHGDAGNDSLLGGTGRDHLLGGAGHDSLFADQGGDDAGRDNLFGGNGADYLESLVGADLLFGGAGADRLDSRDAGALLNGGSGDDTLIASGSMATVVTGPGEDLVQLSNTGAVVELGRGETGVFSDAGATLRFTSGDGRVEVVSEAMEEMVFHIQSGASGMGDLTIAENGYGGTLITWGRTVVLLDDFHPDQLSPDQFIFG